MITDTLIQNDPAIAIDPILFEVGFKAGRRSMLRGSLSDNASYLMGFRAGLMFYQSRIPAGIKEGADEVGWGNEKLNSTYLGSFSGDRPPMI